MSTQYTTEPPPTATVLLHTTAGPLTISLFAAQTPLTCRNFLQLCLDGYYDNVVFHRVSPGFVIQTGDPTGTGEGGQNIYEDREFEKLDADWARLLRTDEGEPVNFGDEVHSRLKFNRRGLVGMAKGAGEKDSGYGSQFFITLGDCRAQLEGRCTMFGRVEGDGIYNVVKVAEAELIDGTERPMYPEKILRVEVVEVPKQDAWQKMVKRDRIAVRNTTTAIHKDGGKKKPVKKKGAKALLSFGTEEEGTDNVPLIKSRKAKFNTALIENTGAVENAQQPKNSNGQETGKPQQGSMPLPQKRKAEVDRSPSPKRRKPSFHDSTTQLPLRNPESPSRSPAPEPRRSPAHRRRSSASKHKYVLSDDERSVDAMARSPEKAGQSSVEAPPNLLSEIAALKASMRRGDGHSSSNHNPYASSMHKKSALESLIPSTSIRGRRRPRPGENNNQDDDKSLKMLAAFKAKLDGARPSETIPKQTLRTKDHVSSLSAAHSPNTLGADAGENSNKAQKEEEDEDEEARLCDLHFISNCQSCFSHDTAPFDSHNGVDSNGSSTNKKAHDDDDANNFLSHRLTFEKDRLGKDLTWKKKSEEDLVVIDPRERERELGIGRDGERRHKDRGSRKEERRGRDGDWSKRQR